MRHKDLGNTCVLGLQWGDEGKGKVVDLLVEHFDVVARYAGGANAGHTVVIDGDRFALHQVPSGVLHDGIVNVIAGGAVIDPAALLGEIESLRQRGIRLDRDKLRISDRAHLVFPWHRREDVIAEGAGWGQNRHDLPRYRAVLRGQGRAALGHSRVRLVPANGAARTRRGGLRLQERAIPHYLRVPRDF
jgi:adenylosuccinate synthase